MKKIAIFVSGEGKAAERIVKLFNEGNRVRTELVFVDDSAVSLLERLKEEDVTLIHIPDEEWNLRNLEIAELLNDNDIKLIVLDNFALPVSAEIMESTQGELIRLSSPEQAPREVVAALEADLRKPVEEVKVEREKEQDPTPESEWADALKIQFTPPKIPTTPPEVPEKENIQPQSIFENQTRNSSQGFPRPDYNRYHNDNNREQEHRHDEPMPSTYLIWSILVTIFCCFIPGIIAIIFSSQVSARYYAGDIEGARQSSRTAEIWIIVSVVLGVVAATLYFPFMLIGG